MVLNMALYSDETELPDIHMIQMFMGMFEGRRHLQRIVSFGLLGMEYDDELDDTGEDDYESDNWPHGYSNFHGYPRLSDMSNDRGLRGNHTRSSSSIYQPPPHYYTPADLLHPPSVKVQPKENDTERKARLVQGKKKSKGKAEKKRLKKQKQKEKRREKLEKEEQNEGKNDTEKSEAEESEPVNDKPKDGVCDNDSCASEELDMTSTFVRKAALIARRKLQQKPKSERKEKKVPKKTVPDKPNEDPEEGKKDSASPIIPSIEDNIKISTELAVIGNQFASSGDFNMAVKYFTDAIRYNPKEFKLFGNRSFCFEKMQEYKKALTDAEVCLNMCPGWVKGLFRKGRALAGLKRYEEAARAFRDVLALDGSYMEAARELMRVQMTHLMECGFTREQSSTALLVHGTVETALEALSKLNRQPGAALPPAQVVNITGVSPVLSAMTNPAPPQSQDAPKTSHKNNPLGQVQNMSNVQSQPKPAPNQAMKSSIEKSQPPPELFPVWVGNLMYPVTESVITNLFNKAGAVYGVKVLGHKRCAFVNYTKPEYCEEAIRHFHGFELNGMKLAVRYPDRIPHGMGISKSALRADDLQDENIKQSAVGDRRPVCSFRPVSGHRDDQKP